MGHQQCRVDPAGSSLTLVLGFSERNQFIDSDHVAQSSKGKWSTKFPLVANTELLAKVMNILSTDWTTEDPSSPPMAVLMDNGRALMKFTN